MKDKNKKKWIGLCFFAVLTMGLWGCKGSQEQYQEGSYKANDFFSQSFETRFKEKNQLTVHFEKDLFEETKANKIFGEMEAEYHKISQASGNKVKPISIYIIMDTHKSGIIAKDRNIICSMKEIENKKYRQIMVREAFNIKEFWKVAGLEYYLFKGENFVKDFGNEELKKEYSEKKNKEVLSLLPYYFLSQFTDQEQLILAQKTAYSLTEFQIMNGNLKEFLSGKKDVERKQQWIEMMGIKQAGVKLPFQAKDLELKEDQNNKMLLSKDNQSFSFASKEWMNTNSEITSFLEYWYSGYQSIQDSLSKQGQKMKDFLDESWKKPLHIVFIDENFKNEQLNEDTIYLKKGDDPFYLLVEHLLKGVETKDEWLKKGLALYLSRENEPEWLQEDFIKKEVSILTKGLEYGKLTKEEKEIADDLRVNYEKRAQSPVTEQNFNYWIYYQAKGITSLTELVRTKKTISQLDEPQAYALTQYLVSNYGIDSCMKYLQGEESFKEVFRNDLRTVIKKFLQSMES